jgi:hypothetical protein
MLFGGQSQCHVPYELNPTTSLQSNVSSLARVLATIIFLQHVTNEANLLDNHYRAAAATRQLFALEAAERILACTITRDRLSAINTKVGLALCARKEGIFALNAEIIFAHFTGEPIFALEAE